MSDSGIFGGINTLIWGTDAKKVYGTKPNVPSLPSLQDAQKTAATANIANFADIAKLATQTNNFNQEQLNALIDKTIPGARETIQKNLASRLRGEIPQDVQDALFRANAERGGALTHGSGFQGHVTARDIESTSYQISKDALSSTETWLQGAKAPSFDATSMFISPMQQSAANTDQFNREFLANKIAAAPDPVARGQFDSTMALIGEVLSAYGGGAGYQGTYNQNATTGGGLGGTSYGPGGVTNATQNNGGWYLGNNTFGFGKSGDGQYYMGKQPGSG